MAMALLAACAGHLHPPRRVPPGAGDGVIPYEEPRAPVSSFADGETVARHLQERYDETFPYCEKFAGDPNPLPAVLCSGIILRVSKRGPGFNIWNPNPNSSIKNGVSFSWLRKDAAFNSLAFSAGSGFIILPYFYADSPGDGYTQLVVLCGFPFDGWTWERRGGNNDGCDQFQIDAGSRPCQAQGITNAQQWIQRYGAVIIYAGSCGFTLKPQTPGANVAFRALVDIRRTVPNSFQEHNEIMLSTWRANDPNLPIEAFFYIVGTAGRAEAMLNQVDYKNQIGRWIPVIQITLPTFANGPAVFRYLPADQGVAADGTRQRCRC
jgi:hypothetical protein